MEPYCNKCPRHCPLSSPKCPMEMSGNDNPMPRRTPDTPETMIMEIGHRLHHGLLDRETFLSGLSEEEKNELKRILSKVLEA